MERPSGDQLGFRMSPSWGNLIAEGQTRYRIAPWMIILPTAAILITTLGFNLLGDAVRDALDPRTSQLLVK